jgi:cell division transport system permease protein
MQLVGARSRFIQKPFLIRAGLHGFISGIIASSLIVGLLSLATKRIEELSLIQNNERLLILIFVLIAIGIFVAVASTYRAVSKYLKLSLDELY